MSININPIMIAPTSAQQATSQPTTIPELPYFTDVFTHHGTMTEHHTPEDPNKKEPSGPGHLLLHRSGGEGDLDNSPESKFSCSNDNGRNASSNGQLHESSLAKQLTESISSYNGSNTFSPHATNVNLPSHFNPLLTLVREDLPFFTPPELILENPLLNPWIPQPNQPPNPQNATMEEVIIEGGLEEPLSPSFIEMASLNGVALMLFKEMEDKKYIYQCPPNLKKCSMDFCPPFISRAANVPIVLSPTLRNPSEEIIFGTILVWPSPC
ncbi:hypothetical protein H5410_045958 [Solanum commersonii]|uniref:Uncharacterized protein n=1 Tax=Solanum commersonii TaxID=4109 RepID=A0A9J5XE81_SOLCO|nr:hypothetical protein H5410_045958 [Solanum commersonii]